MVSMYSDGFIHLRFHSVDSGDLLCPYRPRRSVALPTQSWASAMISLSMRRSRSVFFLPLVILFSFPATHLTTQAFSRHLIVGGGQCTLIAAHPVQHPGHTEGNAAHERHNCCSRTHGCRCYNALPKFVRTDVLCFFAGFFGPAFACSCFVRRCPFCAPREFYVGLTPKLSRPKTSRQFWGRLERLVGCHWPVLLRLRRPSVQQVQPIGATGPHPQVNMYQAQVFL